MQRLDMAVAYGLVWCEANHGVLADMARGEALRRYPGLGRAAVGMDDRDPGGGRPREDFTRIRAAFARRSSDMPAGRRFRRQRPERANGRWQIVLRSVRDHLPAAGARLPLPAVTAGDPAARASASCRIPVAGRAAAAWNRSPMQAYTFGEPIRTPRLVLRPFVPEDLDALHAIYGDPGVHRWLYSVAHTPEQTRASLDKKMARRAVADDGDGLSLAACLAAGGDLIADVSLWCTSATDSQAEIGYTVHPRHQGHGYAAEACAPLLAIAFDAIGMHRVAGRLEARNAASARVLEKLGMRREAHLVENEWVKGEWQSEVVYAILDRDWRASPRPYAADRLPGTP